MKITLFFLPHFLALSCPLAIAHEKPKGGYMVDTQGHVVTNSYGQCWRSGSWTPAMATAECDGDLVKKTVTPAVLPDKSDAVGSKIVPGDTPKPIKPVVRINLRAETLFDFDKWRLRDEGKKALDKDVIENMKKFPQISIALATGHTDQIGSVAYNQKLSDRRAKAVIDYLVSQGIEAERLQSVGKGKKEPVKNIKDCKTQKSKKAKTKKQKRKELIACLQPNRRVTVEIKAYAPESK